MVDASIDTLSAIDPERQSCCSNLRKGSLRRFFFFAATVCMVCTVLKTSQNKLLLCDQHIDR